MLKEAIRRVPAEKWTIEVATVCPDCMGGKFLPVQPRCRWCDAPAAMRKGPAGVETLMTDCTCRAPYPDLIDYAFCGTCEGVGMIYGETSLAALAGILGAIGAKESRGD